MTPPRGSRPRSAVSPAARAMRLQRIFARMQEGASHAEIAAEERISGERLRQIMRQATARSHEDDQPDHSRMQFARLLPALRLVSAGVAGGDVRAIPLLLNLVDRLDRYSDPDTSFRSPALAQFIAPPPRPRRPVRRRPAEKLLKASPDADGEQRPAG
jgi:hypothetical protein